ncbi:FkbM family methyltransferase [Martelella radicis]|uniref:FkbM family methyltransferase n=1 Tax=Martelella radicis TaxID=1397476 RepID=A0A7W6KIL5_9HYPH|nr:FkbM family methyltransferase [Martelella radicis]MBB4121680.1 FkbM family methyltransferase [Martelella radicis]
MNPIQRRMQILEKRDVNVVLDVGANAGQFAQELRANGYAGRIISFEPTNNAFATLSEAAESDAEWTTMQLALGEFNDTAVINVSENSFSSSLLEAKQWSIDIESSIRCVAQEEVQVRRLDSIFEELIRPNDRTFLKVDTQGFELPVIRGALGCLRRIPLIQLEVSFRSVYSSEPPAHDVLSVMAGLGYRVVLVGDGWDDPGSAELLQADFMFAAER